jgi:cortactin
VDKSAVGWEYHEDLKKHESQTDYTKGFGGKFGVQNDRVDRSAHSYDEQVEPVGTAYERTRPSGESISMIFWKVQN